jgi:hypothetical protein
MSDCPQTAPTVAITKFQTRRLLSAVPADFYIQSDVLLAAPLPVSLYPDTKTIYFGFVQLKQ